MPIGSNGVDASFTAKQGQYLAFIYYYTKVNGRAPAEADIARYFGVSAPAVHLMIVKLHARLDYTHAGPGSLNRAAGFPRPATRP